jgi:hypothetical protein
LRKKSNINGLDDAPINFGEAGTAPAPEATKANQGSPVSLEQRVILILRIAASVVGAEGFEPPTYAL